MRDCVVAGSGWSGQRMERNRFWQSEQRVLHEAVWCPRSSRKAYPGLEKTSGELDDMD